MVLYTVYSYRLYKWVNKIITTFYFIRAFYHFLGLSLQPFESSENYLNKPSRILIKKRNYSKIVNFAIYPADLVYSHINVKWAEITVSWMIQTDNDVCIFDINSKFFSHLGVYHGTTIASINCKGFLHNINCFKYTIHQFAPLRHLPYVCRGCGIPRHICYFE